MRLVVKPSDIFVLAGVLAYREDWTFRALAAELHAPHAAVQRALSRAQAAGLYQPDRQRVNLPSFGEFAVHAIRFVAPVALGAIVPGVPAAWAAEPMVGKIRSSGQELPPVWPSAHGRVRGQALEPLHRSAPEAVASWPVLGRYLALLDSLRGGDPRVRVVAARLLAREIETAA
ncbi:MAG: hypothetical protein ACR2GL_06120 [Thermoleophilaceae bacterium]